MKRILTSIWFLALIITVPLIALMPPVFSKYRLAVDSIEKRLGVNGQVYFIDLQNDGKQERIESFQTEQNMLSFQCFDSEDKLYNQFNFPFNFNVRTAKLFFFDFDEDDLTEVFGFTVKEDSLFLSYVEPYDPLPKFQTYFVAKIDTRRRSDLDVSVTEMVFFDFNGDGNKELVFSPQIGYNWFPRKLYVFHPESGKMESSEEFGVHFSALTPFDFKADGKIELVCTGSSADNIPVDVEAKYHDDRPRLFVFNSELKEEFESINFPRGVGSRIEYYFLDEEDGHLILLYYNYSTENPVTFVSDVYIDGRQQKFDSLIFRDSNWKYARMNKEDEDRFVIFTDRGRVFWIDSNLQVVHKKDLQFNLQHVLRDPLDILDGGEMEYYTVDAKNHIHLFLNNFEDEIEMAPEVEVNNRAMLIDSPKENQFVLVTDELLQYTSINQNPFYYLKYPGYLAIYLFLVLLIWFWQKSRMRLLQEKFELRSQVRELRLKTFRNQLNPHFIFNTFNGVASVIKKGDTEQAYEVFMRFSRMTRNVLDNFEESIVPLSKEIDLVTNFLELQKFRFKDLFNCDLLVTDKSIYNIPVPRMIMQVHVENAIQHGLIPKAGNGLLKLEIREIEQVLRITIEDNGIGRENAKANQTEHNGIGLKTIERVIEEVNFGKKNKIKQEIIDLKSKNGEACGTRIELYIPKDVTKNSSHDGR